MPHALRFFQGFRGSAIQENVIWQQSTSIWPYQCSQCGRKFPDEHGQFPENGLRYLASSLTRQSHNAAAVLCPDCKTGRDPLREKRPVYAERRTGLD